MVGYAYSSTSDADYSCILIKSYDCDDFSFVNNSTVYQEYRVCRSDFSVAMIYPQSTDELRHLRLENILQIVKNVIMAEYKNGYPVVVSWCVNFSGICEVKSVSDFDSFWPLTPYHIESGADYINVTGLFFNKSPLYFKSGFVADVINLAAYCCGICIGDVVTVIGDEIYCTFEAVFLFDRLFKTDCISETVLKYVKKPPAAIKKIRAKGILSKIKGFSINDECIGSFASRELYLIKVNCVKNLVSLFEYCLKNNKTFCDLINYANKAFAASFSALEMCRDTFAFYSGKKETADINYLTFDEVMMTFSFGKFKEKIASIVKTNRNRKRMLKECKIPSVIYKGKLYFEN